MFGAITDSMQLQRVSSEKCLDSQLWHACVGAMVQMPPLNSKVFYFPQGHAEHAFGKVDFGGHHTRIPSLIPCRVSSLKYMADPDTDEVYVKLRLTPLREQNDDICLEEEDGHCFMGGGADSREKPASFAKTLTQSDANNGGGFSVPRYCAETIFPRLDYSAEPPVQTIIAKDVHGQCWKFRHIYRGTPRRHLLTTGWSNFVNQKKLVAGDSIVFMRAENGDLCVGISRAKKGGSNVFSSNWNRVAPPLFGGEHCSGFLCDNENKLVSAESVVEAVNCAVNGRPFEVVYYPRAGTPEFFVETSAVRTAMQRQWCPGMRFKMPFETEDSSRISWFMGTISSVQVADPIHWPDSPWRLLQVVWDEPDLLQNVKRVNPWLVEIVSNIPTFPLSQFSPPRKKPRFLEHHPDFQLINHLPMPPSFSSNILNHHTNSHCNIQDNNSSSGIQVARHAQNLGLSPSDFPFTKLQSDMLLSGFQRLDHSILNQPLRPPCGTNTTKNNVDISCLLTVGDSGQNLKETSEVIKSPHILLFGQLIHTEEQSPNSFSASTNGSSSSSGGTLQLKMTSTNNNASSSDGLAPYALHQNSPIQNSSDEGSPCPWYKDQHKSDLGAENVTLLCLAL